MPRKLDPFWEYGVPDAPNDRVNLSCKLCGKEMSGGVYRLKFHLAKIPGHDVEPCTNITPELIQRAMRALETLEQNREAKEELKRQLKRSAEGSGPSGTGSTAASANLVVASSFFVPRTTPGSQPSIGSMLKRTEKEQADKLLAKFLLWSDIPFNIVRNNPFFQPAVDAIASVGLGYKIPSYHDFRGRILQNEKRDYTQILEDLGHHGQKQDALLCQMVGLTKRGEPFLTSWMLMDRHPTLFWTPCTAHCIDLMLEDIEKIPFVKDIVDSSKSITKFIYNHTSVLSLMRRFTNNKELVRPAITRFATSFISLLSLLISMWDVKRMFLSEEWRALPMSRKPEGEPVCRLVSYQEDFWAGVKEVCAVTEPLVKVLRLVDGDKPAMGYLYEAMDRAKEAIRAYYDDKGDDGFQKQLLLWGVIDERWNNTLHRPIHAARLSLNPAFSYACEFDFDAEIMDGFLSCV
eukprot:PITA_17056